MSRYEKSAAWLNANLAEKETIFNSNFDDFPPLFYRLSGRQFVSGLDPVFLYLHDSDKYQLWVSIVKGEIVPQPEKIKKVFNSQILFSKNSNTRLIEILTVHPGWSLSYKDEEVHIFQAK
jgi:hypothetical protein